MFLVTAFAITNFSDPNVELFSIWKLIFVYIQLLLVLGSAKVSQNSNNGSNASSTLAKSLNGTGGSGGAGAAICGGTLIKKQQQDNMVRSNTNTSTASKKSKNMHIDETHVISVGDAGYHLQHQQQIISPTQSQISHISSLQPPSPPTVGILKKSKTIANINNNTGSSKIVAADTTNEFSSTDPSSLSSTSLASLSSSGSTSASLSLSSPSYSSIQIAQNDQQSSSHSTNRRYNPRQSSLIMLKSSSSKDNFSSSKNTSENNNTYSLVIVNGPPTPLTPTIGDLPPPVPPLPTSIPVITASKQQHQLVHRDTLMLSKSL